jgi:hypothetical protein
MKKIFLTLLLIFSFSVLANDKQEPDSPPGNYRFSLSDIQKTVRQALVKADRTIKLLEINNELEDVAAYYFDDYLEKIASYNENSPKLVNLAESYKTDLTNAYVLKEFKESYPHLIYDKSKWMFNSVGGIYANTIILYCSPKEYIVLWGTTLQAYGKFSGYYPFMNEFDVMVRGEMLSHDLDAPGHASVIYRPMIQDHQTSNTVDSSNLIPGNVRSYSLESHSYMVSYAQGNIAKAFIPGAIMPGIFVNQDWHGLYTHIAEGIKAYVNINKKKDKKYSHWRQNPNYRAIAIIDSFHNRNKGK